MSIEQQIHEAIAGAIPGAEINVTGGGGHFEIHVVSDQFAGKRIIQKHRMVLSAIKGLMAGDNAPVHAIDKLVCELPA